VNIEAVSKPRNRPFCQRFGSIFYWKDVNNTRINIKENSKVLPIAAENTRFNFCPLMAKISLFVQGHKQLVLFYLFLKTNPYL
jgi:hypothetical protein